MRARPASLAERLQLLVDASETGRDVAGLLAAARAATGAAAAYVLGEDGSGLRLVSGEGPERIDPPGLEPETRGGMLLVPLVSARRVVGCLALAQDVPGADVRLLAGVAAQAVDAARLWEATAGTGALDRLTGLPGHRAFERVVARELARARRAAEPVAVAVVGVDGDEVGDETVRTAAGCFEAGVRPYDTVCRLGAADFGLVLPGIDAEPARTLVARLAAAFASSADGATVSGGVAAFPDDGDTRLDLMRLATGTLHWARSGGGGRIVAYDPSTVETLSPEERASQLERDTTERTLRALEAARGRSRSARAVSDYAGHIAAGVGLPPERADRVRLAAFLYDVTAPAADTGERGRSAARVAEGTLDDEAAGWLAATGADDAPVEARAIAVAAAFVEAGGHLGGSGAGRALAHLWEEPGRFDPACIRALESLLSASA
jgi:diguanylate cyclase (GGDEF)-like protein